uniref:Uncharacterized protein n=1 Tax=Balaenoptera musculus TaxID=9771 RepID=A0A8C0I746_BALMU
MRCQLHSRNPENGFLCCVSHSASVFLTAPVLGSLLALGFLLAAATLLNKWQGLSALVSFTISITAAFSLPPCCLHFYVIFHNVAEFLKQGDSAEVTTAHRMEVGNSDCDSGGGQGAVCWEGGCDFSE